MFFEEDAIIVFVGAMGTGKSTFAQKKFFKHEVVSTDQIREDLTGDFEEQTHNDGVFEILYKIIDVRAKAGLFTVIDSTGSNSMLSNIVSINKAHNRPLHILKFPHLTEEQLTKERMKHRMNYIHAYRRQVDRIDKAVFHKDFTVHVLDDIDNVEIKTLPYDAEHTLSSDYKYIVIPDLHGEYRALDDALGKYGDDDRYKFIFLGDIVDRGESSYITFRTVNNLIKSGKAVGVSSNHDNKLMRYFRKWLNDPSLAKFTQGVHSTYGMKIAHGLEKTLNEFYSLSKAEMNAYATDFVRYYDNTKSYYKVTFGHMIHFFAHAGVTFNMIAGVRLSKKDHSSALYDTLTSMGELSHKIATDTNIDSDIAIHLGHDHITTKITSEIDHYETFVHLIYKHDIGLGKLSFEEVEPDFMIIGDNNGS